MTTNRDPKVLVVDDDPQILDVFSKFLDDAYHVQTAVGGREALDVMSDDIDVVLLDRRMPGMKGREVLALIREHGYECRVAMVTAVEPDLDIIDMGFDDYLVKPVTQSNLENVIDSLLRWDDYDAVLREYFEVARKVGLLEEEKSAEDLDSSEEYQELKRRLTTLKPEADESIADFETGHLKSIMNTTIDERNSSDDSDGIRYSS